tara:strand:- start:29 stop:133 length:105 start_codon:yes stop_codon:yes gene_type:complete
MKICLPVRSGPQTSLDMAENGVDSGVMEKVSNEK